MLIALGLLVSSTAFADWKEERKWFDGAHDGFVKTYGGSPELVMLEKDLDGKPVDPDEVARRPGSYLIGVTCAQVVEDLRPYAIKDGEPNQAVLDALAGVETITCQYAHYFKGRDKALDVGSTSLPAGNPLDKNEPASDCKLIFEPASGGKITAIHIVMNRHFYDMSVRGQILADAIAKRFPDADKKPAKRKPKGR
ncbi:MAG TPA: hypothetical protein VLX92_17265 [Kofleriaceae bacterium]|nr:hypothetical protein [Kofleriaceae bacterium]